MSTLSTLAPPSTPVEQEGRLQCGWRQIHASCELLRANPALVALMVALVRCIAH